MPSVICTSCTEARMVWARSTATFTSMEGEIEPVSPGRSALTRSITSRMLAPACRRTIMGTARSPSVQAATRLFSMSSMTSATSPRRTAAPSL